VSWRHRALCHGAGADQFVPETADIRHLPPPIVTALCPICPVRDECESYGRTSGSSGWWGGSFLFWGMTMEEWQPWIVRPVAELQCVVCGDPFTSVQTTAIYCTNRCQMRAFRARRRAGEGLERRVSPVASLVCTVCKTPFTAKRADALYCSNSCAQKKTPKVSMIVTISLVVEVAA
jgi:predicted nucleic acid-binding Zn ribbon protein